MKNSLLFSLMLLCIQLLSYSRVYFFSAYFDRTS
jgi:hypothetical protein